MERENERVLMKESLIETKSARDEFLDEIMKEPVGIEVETKKQKKEDGFDFDKAFNEVVVTTEAKKDKNSKTSSKEETKAMYARIKADKREELIRTDEELFRRSVELYNFITILYLERGGKEIRLLSRNRFENKHSPRLESILLWTTPSLSSSDEKKKEKAKENVKKIFTSLKSKNGLSYCLYVGCGIVKYDESLLKQNKLMLKEETFLGLDFLSLDLDDYTEEQYLEKRKFLENIGIKTLDIFSGHGYQMYFLLKERSEDREAQNTFAEIIKKLEWNFDESVNSSYRISRGVGMPNCKQYQLGDSKEVKSNPRPIETRVVNSDAERLDLNFILSSLNNVEKEDNRTFTKNASGMYQDENGLIDPFANAMLSFKEEVEENKENTTVSIINPIKEKSNEKIISENESKQEVKGIEKIDEKYYDIPFKSLPNSVRRIFIEILENTTYDVLMYLIPMFVNRLSFDYEQTKSVLERLYKQNERLGYKDFVEKGMSMYETVKKSNKKGLFGKITQKLIEAYGDELHYVVDEAVIQKNKKKIIIHNSEFTLLKETSEKEKELKPVIDSLKRQIKELKNKKIGAESEMIIKLDLAIKDLNVDLKEQQKKKAVLFSVNDFRLLTVIKKFLREKQEQWFTLEELAEYCGMHIETIKTNIKPLLREQYIVRRKNYKKENQSYEYVLNDFKNKTDLTVGYTEIEGSTCAYCLEKLGNSELVMYFKLLSMPENTLLSQQSWGEMIGYERKAVNEVFKRLKEKGFINFEQVFIDSKGKVTTNEKEAIKILIKFTLNY